MKKIKNYLSIAFFLVIGATFADQINSAIDYLLAVDYTAIGETIKGLTAKAVEFAKAAFNYVVELFNTKTTTT